MSYYARATLTVVLVVAGLAAAWTARGVLILVLIAAVLALGLDPAVRQLQRLRLKRGWAVALIVLAAVLFAVLFAVLIVPPLVREVRHLAADIPGYVERLQQSSGWIGDLERNYNLSERLRELTSRLPTVASSSLAAIFGFTKSIGSVIFSSLTVAILTIYFLLALPRGHRMARWIVRREHQERGVQLFEEALERVAGYVSGNIAISIIAGIVSFIALTIIGVPFPAALAMWVAIADLIPSVGAMLGAIVAIIVAAFSSFGDAVATTIYFIVYQQTENYVIAPRVMKKAVDLSPAAVIVSVLIGATLAGFAGALLALPVAAAAKVFVRDLWLKAPAEAADA